MVLEKISIIILYTQRQASSRKGLMICKYDVLDCVLNYVFYLLNFKLFLQRVIKPLLYHEILCACLFKCKCGYVCLSV